MLPDAGPAGIVDRINEHLYFVGIKLEKNDRLFERRPNL
jgi:hypothetical protein